MTPDQEFAWAAGLFEGEGSISHSQPHLLRLSLAMTDGDVVRRFGRIVECGSFGGWQGQPPRKYTYQWYVDGQDAVELLRRLMLFLGYRRRQTAGAALARRARHVAEVTAPRSCERCGATFVPEFKAGHRPRFCSPKCWSTRTERRRRRAELSHS